MNFECPNCKSTIGLNADGNCSACNCSIGKTTTSFQKQTTLIRPAPRPKLQVEVDVAITIDRTGSSLKFQTGIPQTVDIILPHLQAKARSLKVWVQSHGDEDFGQHPVMHTAGGSAEQALADVRAITYGGGGDSPEHHLDGIHTLLTSVPWTADPRRARGAIIAFLTAETKPSRLGVSAAQIGKQFAERGLLLYLICEPTDTLRELVNAASGLMFEISNSPDPAQLQKIAAQLAASVVATVSSGSTVPMTVARI